MVSSFFIYFCTLAGIGAFFYRRTKTAQDFMLGDRSLNYWVTAIATQASDMGSWLFLAFPAAVYLNGMFECWTAVGLTFFMFLTWQFIAPKLREQTEKYQANTVTSYLSKHVHDSSGSVAVVSAAISLLFFTFYIASALVGMGRLFEAAFEISYQSGVIIGLAAALVYTLIGGFIAVAWCDLFQGIFLLIAIMLVPLYTFFVIGGIQPIVDAAHAQHVSLSLWPSGKSLLSSLALAAGWGLGYFGQIHILANFMGIDSVKKINAAKYVGITWQILVLTSSACIGLVGLAYFSHGITDPQMIFIALTQEQFFPLLAGFILCGIFAATLSTLDSHILVAGTIIANDLYKRFHTNASSTHVVMVSRITSLSVCLAGLIIAWHNNNSIYNLVHYAWAGLGASFGPVLILSLFTHKLTRNGMLAGIITGACVSAIWPYFNIDVLSLVPAFTASFVSALIISSI